MAGWWFQRELRSLGYLKSLQNRELRSYPQVSKHILGWNFWVGKIFGGLEKVEISTGGYTKTQQSVGSPSNSVSVFQDLHRISTTKTKVRPIIQDVLPTREPRKKPRLVGLYRGLYCPVIWGL